MPPSLIKDSVLGVSMKSLIIVVVGLLCSCGDGDVDRLPTLTVTEAPASSPSDSRTFLPTVPPSVLPSTLPAIPKSPSDPLPAVTVTGEVVDVRAGCLELSTDAGSYAVVGEHDLAVGDVVTVRGRAAQVAQSPCGPFVLNLIEGTPG
ncbi:MAG TPA: hypothetical protein VFD41_06700 [Actinomycetales bacterium]|nr:hypothetical protein [Actinomycetales bacterium]